MKTLKQALAESINTITARVINKTGPESVINLIDKLGIDTSNILPVAAIALGTPDISVYDMVSAYSTFANKGVYVKPYAIQRIEDKNGTILYQHQPQSRDVLSEESAFVTIKLLEGVTRFGSGKRLRLNSDYAKGTEVYKRVVTGYPYTLENDIAGKTGTTQNQSDGWFIGMVPNLATGVWVGGEDRSVRFPTITYGQGATLALPIWGMYMTDIYNDGTLDISKDKFERPENLNIEINCDGDTDELENGEGENRETTEFEIDF
jgi:penicillin-binding protein 1A